MSNSDAINKKILDENLPSKTVNSPTNILVTNKQTLADNPITYSQLNSHKAFYNKHSDLINSIIFGGVLTSFSWGILNLRKLQMMKFFLSKKNYNENKQTYPRVK